MAKMPQLWPFNCYICTKLTERYAAGDSLHLRYRVGRVANR